MVAVVVRTFFKISILSNFFFLFYTKGYAEFILKHAAHRLMSSEQAEKCTVEWKQGRNKDLLTAYLMVFVFSFLFLKIKIIYLFIFRMKKEKKF